MKVDVSFKKTTREVKLYTTVMAEEEKSEFVKKALAFYIKHLESNNNKEVEK